jgi:hypothetical protein
MVQLIEAEAKQVNIDPLVKMGNNPICLYNKYIRLCLFTLTKKIKGAIIVHLFLQSFLL